MKFAFLATRGDGKSSGADTLSLILVNRRGFHDRIVLKNPKWNIIFVFVESIRDTSNWGTVVCVSITRCRGAIIKNRIARDRMGVLKLKQGSNK